MTDTWLTKAVFALPEACCSFPLDFYLFIICMSINRFYKYLNSLLYHGGFLFSYLFYVIVIFFIISRKMLPRLLALGLFVLQVSAMGSHSGKYLNNFLTCHAAFLNFINFLQFLPRNSRITIFQLKSVCKKKKIIILETGCTIFLTIKNE